MSISNTERALAALNLSGEADRLTAIDRERKETAAAVDRGKQKTMSLSQELAHIRDNRGDGEVEAEALRAGEDVATIAKTEETIRGEREAVQAGMRKLGADIEQLAREKSAVHDQAKAKLAKTFDSLLAEMDEEARQLASRLTQLWADAMAIRGASGNAAATKLSTALHNVVDEAACSNMIGRSKPVPASQPLVDLLTSHADKIKIAGGGLHLQHRTPRL